MSTTVIKMSLDPKDIERAIKEVKSFKRNFLKKVDIYRKRLAEEIATNAQTLFNSSTINDVVSGGTKRATPRNAEVNVYVTDVGNISVVVADGEDAIWCEFGAGVYHNGSVGSSPNAWGGELGFTIGSYGKGQGRKNAWGFYAEPGDKETLTITRGTPATMPMYTSAVQVTGMAIKIAKEVFG